MPIPELIRDIAALDGLLWLCFAAASAGIVRGFSGFGTAMIFLPLVAMVLDPVWAVLALVGMDILGPLLLVPRLVKQARLRDLVLLLVFCLLCLPLGIALLSAFSPETYRYIVCAIALGLVICLLAGLRYRGTPGTPLIATTGAIAGVSGGLSGIPGPPVILLYMSSQLPVSQMRATLYLFLFGFDWMFLGVLGAQGELVLLPVLLGVALAVPNALGSLAGQAIFDPARASLYRYVAYAIVAASALMGLPIWDG